MLVEGKNAVVTGGTRGIGLAIVRKLLENGANVAVAGSRMETAEAAVASSSRRMRRWLIVLSRSLPTSMTPMPSRRHLTRS